MSYFDIIIPTHGRPYLLARAVKSIRRQAFDDVRLIIISDDPHSQALASIEPLLKPHDLFIQRFHATGSSASRNEGLKHINAEFVLFLDDDDSYAPNFLKDLHHALQTAQGDVFAVDFDVAREFRDDDYADVYKFERWYESLTALNFDELWVKHAIPHQAIIYKSALLQERWFNTDLLPMVAEWAFLLSVLKDHSLLYLALNSYVVEHVCEQNDIRLTSEAYTQMYQAFPVSAETLRHKRQLILAQTQKSYAHIQQAQVAKHNKIVEASQTNHQPIGLDSSLVALVKKGSMSVMDAFNQGSTLTQQGKAESAKAFYQLWLTHHVGVHGRHVVHHALGLLLQKLTQFEAAKNAFEQALKAMPTFHKSRFSLVETLISLNQKEAAKKELAWLVDPKHSVETANKVVFEAALTLRNKLYSE